MRSGWPRNLGELVVSMAGEPEGRRQPTVRAGAENTRGSTGANQRVLPWYRQAKATKRGEKGNEQS